MGNKSNKKWVRVLVLAATVALAAGCDGGDGGGAGGGGAAAASSGGSSSSSSSLSTQLFTMAGGMVHTCVVVSGAVYCWGDDVNGSNAVPHSTYVVGTPGAGQASAGVNLSSVVSIAAAGNMTNTEINATTDDSNYTCFVKSDNSVYCSGYNGEGQLGDNTTNSSDYPVRVLGIGGVGNLAGVTVSAGRSVACAVTTSGTVNCWGNGYMGNGAASGAQHTPVAASNISSIVGVYSGQLHTCALGNAGAVYCWGSDSQLQTGDSGGTFNTSPYTVSIAGVTQMDAGDFHNCAVVSNGVYCWGRNGEGQLGNNGVGATQSTPVAVTDSSGVGSLSGVTKVAAGGNHACALKSDGTVYCWGYNHKGQLGDNSTTQRNIPVAVQGLGGLTVTDITAGYAHSCAKISTGKVYCWGRNTYGQIGDTSTTNRLTATLVNSGANF